MLWLATDGSPQPLPEIDGTDWTDREHQDVQLLHPELDPTWWPRWYALHLNRASDCHVLNHSISWALTESQPQHVHAGLGRRISGWLLLDGHPEDAAQHCATAMLHRRERPTGGTSLLRLHDPAVLWAAWRVLSPGQRSQWLGPVRSWFLLDPLGRLDSINTPAHKEVAARTASLSLAQWDDIENITALNHALRRWIPEAGEAAASNLGQSFEQGMQALRRARGIGVQSLDGLSLFGELALTRHAQFDLHPDVRKLLLQHGPDQPIGGLLAELSESDWLRITVEQPHP